MATKRKSNRRPRKESPDANELLVLELQEIHSAETQLTRIMPRLAKTVESQTLQQMLERRLAEGERVLKDVESALEELEETPGRKKNVAAEGLINDAREHTQEIEPGPALDAVLIASVQKTEHYCIAAWGTVKAIAQAVGQKSTVKAMERALKEGKTYDEQLTELAEREIMPQLLSKGEEGIEEGGDEDTDTEMEEAPRGTSRKNGGNERRVSK
jgi:ferritin-like metal-binding protein YciE